MALRSHRRRWSALASALLGVSALAAGWGATTPAGRIGWAPASSAAIHPGVQLVNLGAQCTAGYVIVDGGRVFLTEAAHCLSVGTPRGAEGDGCSSRSLPIGTPVDIAGAPHRGTIAYSAWIVMHLARETNPDLCTFNDLALVAVDPRDVGLVNPSVPVFGGPTALDTAGIPAGDAVYGFGDSELAFGIGALEPRQGQSVGDTGNGWSHDVLTAPPGTIGDSGSPYLDAHGRALGLLISIELSPVPGTNGVGDLARELAYLRAHSRLRHAQLALGTEPFTGHR